MRLVAVTLNKHDEMLGCGAQMYLGHVCVDNLGLNSQVI